MYRAVANSSLYHCGYKWLVVDMDYRIISKHIDKKSAEDAAFELNNQEKQLYTK